MSTPPREAGDAAKKWEFQPGLDVGAPPLSSPGAGALALCARDVDDDDEVFPARALAASEGYARTAWAVGCILARCKTRQTTHAGAL